MKKRLIFILAINKLLREAGDCRTAMKEICF